MHHLLAAYQERVFEPLFIHDSYACRTGKGTLAASDRLMTFLRPATANGRRPAWALVVHWSPRRLARSHRFQAQYWHLMRAAGDDCLVFFPCGRFIEFYGPQRPRAAAVLRLRVAALPRAGYAFTAGFPVWLSGVYLSRVLRQGLSVVEVRQTPALLRYGGAPRLPWAVWLPTLLSPRRERVAAGGEGSTVR